jgi:hypothetical protein
MDPATIKIFLVHGDPKRLRVADVSSWTGLVVAAPRTEFDDLLARDEARRAGVYFLVGENADTGLPAVYIGEADVIRDRIKSHKQMDFWNHALIVVSAKEALTKAHVRYLEGRLIETAKALGRATLINGQASGAYLPESDRADMEIFLRYIRQILPALGADFLTEIVVDPTRATQGQIFTLSRKGCVAKGRMSAGGFVVLAGSEAVGTLTASAVKSPYIGKLRAQLLAAGKLVTSGDRLSFASDVEVGSPSTAAAIVAGNSMNGRAAWRTKDGKSLGEVE